MAIELKTFVEESLKQIIDGVRTAQVHALEKGGLVNPIGVWQQVAGDWRLMEGEVDRFGQNVQFDVAITANEDSKASGGIGVFVGAFGVGSKGETGEAASSMSRIQFSVPLALPQQSVPKHRAG